jgi:AbrB family looped-hinge helix DNA binding protein
MERARVTAEGRMSLPVEMRRRHGLDQGGEVLVEDTGDMIILRTVDQAVARAQAMSKRLIAGQPGASVEDFLADRAKDAAEE